MVPVLFILAIVISEATCQGNIVVPRVDKSKYESSYVPPFILRNAPISVDVLLHSAYFTIETSTTSYSLLLEVTREILDNKRITGCGVGDLKSKNFDFARDFTAISPDTYENKKDADEFEAVLKCRDLPLQLNSSAFVEYKFTDDITLAVEAEKPVSFHYANRDESTSDYSVVTCVNANDGDTPWLGEFIRYQKTLGVDHVHVNVFDEYIISGRLYEMIDTMEDVRNLILEGYVNLEMWNNWYELDAVVPNQFSDLVRKLDCINQYRHLYDYVFALNTEDFFTPTVKQTTLKGTITKFCPRPKSCSFKSVQYFPGHCQLQPHSKEAPSGNITDFLKSRHNEPLTVTKALLYNDAIGNKVNGTGLVDGYEVVDVPADFAYFAQLDVKAKTDHC